MASHPPRPIFFYKKNLRFLKEIPELLEIKCSACSCIMLDTCRPHFLSCCNFDVCGICKSRSPNVCPRLSCRKKLSICGKQLSSTIDKQFANSLPKPS